MASISSLSFTSLGQTSERKVSVSTTQCYSSNFIGFRFPNSFVSDSISVRTSKSSSRGTIHCMSTIKELPTVADTKLKFLKAYKRPIPSVYNTVLQELIVQQHLMRYKKSYRYDAVFALGFVTIYDQLMDGYPSDGDREAIFQAYIKALNEDPEQYRSDTQKMEEWARSQNTSSLVEFPSREGEVEGILKDISERAMGKTNFNYSRFFAVGLFRLLELSNATEPNVLEKVRIIFLLVILVI
ncbi:hypothetical protein GIB67_023735 [Kingdonia uniflora]|uniref:Protein THYLAKOID FORMATION1, chloroplastic n=1 Tax=Kingdonia uniflora TaxID=39325 RepID=A0A7J7MGV5_9MAGN|nr:hypothetical protein GIB67_023735 [Kingdonia uniflora]